mmetsp:Transcript_8079/g.20711  ORF Transcript_8079/g.20711 Transcript_8079/m.20711 type:complete len:277 (+) Transcript_8079:304-1134(+)
MSATSLVGTHPRIAGGWRGLAARCIGKLELVEECHRISSRPQLREVSRGAATRVPHVMARSGISQLLEDRAAPVFRRDMRRGAPVCVSRLERSLRSEQLLHHPLPPPSRRPVQRRLAASIACVGVDTVGEQGRHDAGVAIAGGQVQCAPALARGGCGHVGAELAEAGHCLAVAQLGGPQQCRLAEQIPRLQVGTLLHQLAQPRRDPGRGGGALHREVQRVTIPVHPAWPSDYWHADVSGGQWQAQRLCTPVGRADMFRRRVAPLRSFAPARHSGWG